MSLAELRRDPKAACERNVYLTEPGPRFPSGPVGGPCTIQGTDLSDGVFRLQSVPTEYSNSDYFYPWIQTGVGSVRVPKNVPDGTIVMTGGLNGCTLVVSQEGNHYNFYHDADSKYLTPAGIAGVEIARVRPADYDPLDWGHKAFTRKFLAVPGHQGDTSYGHCVMAVRKDGKFGFYVTGSMIINGERTRLPLGLSQCLVTF